MEYYSRMNDYDERVSEQYRYKRADKKNVTDECFHKNGKKQVESRRLLFILLSNLCNK